MRKKEPLKYYLIHLTDDLFGNSLWKAPMESVKNCMVKSAQEYGFKIVKIEEVTKEEYNKVKAI